MNMRSSVTYFSNILQCKCILTLFTIQNTSSSESCFDGIWFSVLIKAKVVVNVKIILNITIITINFIRVIIFILCFVGLFDIC